MERRKHRRIPFIRSVTVMREGTESRQLEAEDISLSGIRLYSDVPVDVGEELTLQFNVVPRGESHALQMHGHVQHVELTSDGYSLGVDFVDID